jgi:cytochrome d ubiquinol oxidase subunit I
LLRTADAVSPVSASSVAITLALFVVVYGVVFSAGIYYINRLIAAGPQRHKTRAEDDKLSPNPLAGARDAGRQVLGGG